MTVVAPKVLCFAGGLGIVGGLCFVVDSLAVDLPGNEHALPNTLGLLVPLLGALLLGGLYVVARAERPGPLLDAGFLLNAVGLVLVAGVDFTRTYALSSLDDDTVDVLLESGPTRPAFLVAGVTFVVGALLFGAALIRGGYGVAAWLYALTAVPSGFAAVLPGAVGASAQVLAGVSMTWLGVALLRSSARAGDSGVLTPP